MSHAQPDENPENSTLHFKAELMTPSGQAEGKMNECVNIKALMVIIIYIDLRYQCNAVNILF